MTTDIVERLQEVGCDREPFTPDHANCVCRLTNEAAAEIARLRAALAAEREACARVAETKPFIHARDTDWGDGVNYARKAIAAAIREME